MFALCGKKQKRKEINIAHFLMEGDASSPLEGVSASSGGASASSGGGMTSTGEFLTSETERELRKLSR